MPPATPVVNQIDHLMIEAEDPSFLFRLFSETLGMTVAWPLEDFGDLVSGGICAGNVNLEFIRFKRERFGSAPPSLAKGEAVFSGLAFEPYDSTASALEALDRRGIPHEEPHDTPNWTDAGFDGPLDAPCVTFLAEYHFDFRGWRRTLRTDLEGKQGGKLGVREAREIRLEAAELSRAEILWDTLLEPHSRPSPHAWAFTGGPLLRLVPGQRDAIRELVLGVGSLKHAREQLSRLGLLGDNSARHVGILPAALQGLSIRLEE
ncbi:hypothetical protein [Archangium lipolyticum]|uniref:hypothetical protein n=1 Tax=Archangium lipolyticum TaxID=2970465 RepID=UPI00214A56B9|nr:hypothetical protein [Archangium lipolyticum]